VALKLDTREPGMVLSGVAHVALLGAALFAATSRPLPPAEEGIPVEVITENQLSEITKGETSAKVALPDAKPRAERQADVRVEREPGEAPKDVPSPPTRPVEVKVADEAVEAAAAPPPPPPPARPLENTPEPPKREAEKQPDPTPVPQPPRRQDIAAIEKEDAEALAKAEAQKAKAEAQVKAAAQAKAKAEADAKRVAEAEDKAKAKAEAEARAKKQAELAEKFNPGDISRLLQSREAPQSSGSAAREVQKTASLGTAAGAAQRLNPSQRDALMGLLRDQLHRCWQAPLAATTSDKPPVPSVRVKLNQDGSLAAEPAIVNSSGDPLFRVVADSATRATRRCAPLRIPAQFQPYYQDWKDLVVNFDPREMG
jgi:colicin import membrane protein